MTPRAKAVLDFWFVETPSEKRFKKDEVFDQLIKDKFSKDYELYCTSCFCLTCNDSQYLHIRLESAFIRATEYFFEF